MKTNPNPHPTGTAEYWLALARDEHAFAKNRYQTAESVLIHKANAADYERRAAQIYHEQTLTLQPPVPPDIFLDPRTGGGADPVTIRARQYQPSLEYIAAAEREAAQRWRDRQNSKNYRAKHKNNRAGAAQGHESTDGNQN